MLKNAHKKILLLILGILFVMIFLRFFTLLSFPDSSIVLQKENLIPLDTNETLTQLFSTNRNNLSKLEFLLRTPGIKPNDNVEIEIAEKDCKKTIRQDELKKTFLASDNLYAVSFPAIPDSRGKTYCLKATFKPQKNNAKKLQLFSMTASTFNANLANENSKINYPNQTLSIRPVYLNNYLWQDFSELNQRMSQYRPWFLKNIYLSLIIFGFIIISLLITVLLILL